MCRRGCGGVCVCRHVRVCVHVFAHLLFPASEAEKYHLYKARLGEQTTQYLNIDPNTVQEDINKKDTEWATETCRKSSGECV